MAKEAWQEAMSHQKWSSKRDVAYRLDNKKWDSTHLGRQPSLVGWPAAGVDDGAASGVQGPCHFWVAFGREGNW